MLTISFIQLLFIIKINNLEETEGIIEKQRMIKDPEEIELIQKACQITDACFNHLKSYISRKMYPYLWE